MPLIRECPVNLECRVVRVDELGSHHMFLAQVVAVDVDEAYMDEKDTFHLSAARPWPTPTGGITAWGNAWEPLDTV